MFSLDRNENVAACLWVLGGIDHKARILETKPCNTTT
jgi:hypothetical protein